MKEKMSAAVPVSSSCRWPAVEVAARPVRRPARGRPGPVSSPVALGPIDAALVGTWTGELRGSFGPAVSP